MPNERLVARVENQPDGSFLICAPTVGVVDGIPQKGVYLNAMEGFTAISIVGRRHTMQLPHKVQGRVVECFIEDTSTPVEYDQPLVRLSQIAEEAVATSGADPSGAGGAVDSDLIPVTAPSDGVFYRKPGPDSPCYVEEGSAVAPGTVLGLVEVMKSFNQIAYGGTGLPERGTIAKILAEDSSEVAFGQTLFLVRPA